MGETTKEIKAGELWAYPQTIAFADGIFYKDIQKQPNPNKERKLELSGCPFGRGARVFLKDQHHPRFFGTKSNTKSSHAMREEAKALLGE